MIKVSVILVTYNSEKSIQRTLDSVISQKGRGQFFNLELIVVDDCSTDKTQLILHHNHISFYSTNSNTGGPNTGRNIGLRHVTGDYICFIDHDDEWKPEKTLSQLLAAQYAPIITTGYSVICPSGTTESVRVLKGKELILFRQNETFLSKLKKEKGRQNTYCSTIMIKNDLKNILFEEHFGMTDYDWILRLFENQRSVEIPKSLMNRYISGDNLSLREDYRKKDYYYTLFTLESYEEKYPREVKLGKKGTHGSRARYFYLINKMKNARIYFLKAPIGLKTLTFYFTSYLGNSLVRKNFRFFG